MNNSAIAGLKHLFCSPVRLSFIITVAMIQALSTFAAERTWTGLGADSLWATTNNWDSGVPAASDTVLFSGSGNGKTSVSLGGGTIANAGISFSTDAASYTIGGSGDTISFAANSLITLPDAALNNQRVGATIIPGGNGYFYNYSSHTLFIDDYSVTSSRNLYMYGNGPITFGKLQRPAADEETNNNYIRLETRVNAPITCTERLTIGELWAYDNALTLNLAPNTTNIFCRDGWCCAINRSGVINGGEGTVLVLRQSNPASQGRYAVENGTVTINVKVYAPGGLSCNSGWQNGTLVLTNPDNDIQGPFTIDRGNCVQAEYIDDTGVTQPLGSASTFNFINPLSGSNPARLRITGDNPSTSDKAFTVDSYYAVIENAGSGLLSLSGSISGNGTITFDGAGPITYSGNRSGTGGLTKSGAGTLTISGANSYSGATTIDNGTLVIAAGGSLGSGSTALTLANGSSLSLNPSASAGFSLTLPATTFDTFANITIPEPVSGISTVTITSHSMATGNTLLSVTAPGAGVSNLIFINDLSDGPVEWIMLNGGPATYSSSNGLSGYTPTSVSHIATLGPGVSIGSDPDGAAIIDSQGVSGPVTLASNLTSIALLSQEYSTDALIDFGEGILAADMIRQVSGSGGLTLRNGTLTAKGANPNISIAGIGTISLEPLTDDASTGLSTSKTYTHLLDCGNQALASINGLTFTKVGTASGTTGSYGWSNFPTSFHSNINDWTNNIPEVAGSGLRTFLYDMVYAGANRTVYLTGLIPGTVYEFRLYLRTWDGQANSIERTARFDFLTDSSAAPVATVTFDMNHNDPTVMIFRYVAATSELALRTICTANTSNPYPGYFGITNEELASAPAAVETGSASLVMSTGSAEPMTVAADLTDNGRTTSLIKEGPGTLTLGGAVSLTGPTILNGGLLDLAPTSGVSQLLSASIAGNGAIVKRDEGSTLLLGANTYSGATVISNGILSVGDSAALGLTSAGTYVESGGALALSGAQYNGLDLEEPIFISGSGPDGLGALRNDSPSPQLYAYSDITLSANATIGGTAATAGFPYAYATSSTGRSDLRNGSFAFGGHTLTKAGPGAFFIVSSDIDGVTDTAAIDITGGVLGLESAVDLQGSENNTVTVGTDTSFDLYQLNNPVLWSVIFQDDSHLTARSSSSSSQNDLSGPVTLNGTVTLDGSYHDTLSGVISGSGGLLKTTGFTHLSGTNNTYAGTTAVTGGSLLALTPTSLPAADFSRVSASDTGILTVRPKGTGTDQPGWTGAEIGTLSSSGAFVSRSASLGFEMIYEDFTFSDTLPLAGIAKFGNQKLTDSSATSDIGPVTVYDGELEISTASHNLDTYSITAGADPSSSSLGILSLNGSASLLTTDPGYYRSGPRVNAGSASGSRGIINLSDNASISGRLYLGYGGNNAEGAIYQSGGSLLNTGGAANDARIGISGHGYYEISGGSLTNKGYTQFGENLNCAGILRQTGGSVVFNSGSVPAAGVVGDYYNGGLAVRAGLGLFHLSGGTLNTGSSKFSLAEWSGENSYNEGVGVLTIEDDADASVGYCELANRNGSVMSVMNLDGGSFATRYIQKGGNNNSANSRAYINFNGGNLCFTDSGSAIRTGANNSAAVLAVHNGGAVIEVDSAASATLELPLDPPAGQGVTYIGINSAGAGYIAPPFVNITGGGGYGATAVATINRDTGVLTDIRVTSPGTGYTSIPAVTLYGGGYTSAASVNDIRIGENRSTGGLTKKGDGILGLNAANSFNGAINVLGGILSVGTPDAIPQGADLAIDGGFLDLGGATLTNSSVSISSGGILNGSVVTATLLKDGSGSADLTGDIKLAPVSLDAENGTPGLYEGRIANRINRTDSNPNTSIVLTTRAVNDGYVSSGGTINGCWWPDNSSYIYTGYLWNRAETNVVWTFGENFDDNTYLVIDGNILLDNDSAGTPTYANLMLTPGPHSFEVRLGQGGGSVGGNWVRTDGYRISFGVDYQGRAENNADNYEPLVDPGDGSLFTIDLPASYTDATVESPPDIPALPVEVATNVGALAEGYSLVYASDVPDHGGIINGSVAGTRYYVDNSLSDSNEFDRVAYYLELVHPSYGRQWIWISFDAITQDRTLIGYPYHRSSLGAYQCANVFQRKVDNMDVLSNVSTITNHVGSATGNIEFWPNNYGQADTLGLGADSSTYDFGDSKSDGVYSGTGHGSFQIHNWGDKTVLFAMDNWGANNNEISLGIGSQPSGNPDWTFNANGNDYSYRRLYVFTRDIIRTPVTPSVTVDEGTLHLYPSSVKLPVPDDIRSKVGSAANGYDILYAGALPTTAATLVDGTVYSINNSDETAPFDRVAYFMELQHPTYGHQWVWISFDSYTTDRTKLGFPNQSGNLFKWQQKVNNMDVVCNVDGITNYVGCATGNVEIWPSNYSGTTIPASGLGGTGVFDYDDSGSSTSLGHGCFQIHNWGDKVTLLAVSHCGNSGNGLGIGIGNNPNITNNDPDYTFTYNAAQYTLKNFYVFVRPTEGMDAGDKLAAVDLTVEAGATLDLGGVTQTVYSVSGAGTVSNGVLAANTVLSPAGDGVVGTLTFTDVSFGPGTVYRADPGDLLDITGSLDVSDMTLHLNSPETLDSAEVYTLIQTTDGVTGTPTPDAPLPSIWKVVTRGNTVLLTKEGGSVIILR